MIENPTPWKGGPPFEPRDTSGYTKSMHDAVRAPEGMWTQTLAEELLRDADDYYRSVIAQKLSRQERSTNAYTTSVRASLAASVRQAAVQAYAQEQDAQADAADEAAAQYADGPNHQARAQDRRSGGLARRRAAEVVRVRCGCAGCKQASARPDHASDRARRAGQGAHRAASSADSGSP